MRAPRARFSNPVYINCGPVLAVETPQDICPNRCAFVPVPRARFSNPVWASPCEKSNEKGQYPKVKFKCLNRKENKATGHKSKFFVSLFCVLGPFWSYWAWAKKCLFLKKHITKIYLMTLKTNFVTPNYIFMLHMTKINIFIFILTKNIFLGKILPQMRFLQLGYLLKMCCSDLVTIFKK